MDEKEVKKWIIEARRIVNDIEMEKDYKVQAFAIVLSYFLATP